ncbi:MAG: hypothetical protein K0U47_11120 [Epsilonproteobacteria bacterium]|nr:hypothetical protein [Campylobacterota bacterium]
MSEFAITTTVLEQNGVYIDPSDGKFLDVLFKEYVRDFFDKESMSLTLSKEDLFFYGENANVYLLNYIYQDLFNSDEKPFNPVLKSKEEGSINLSLFNSLDEQVKYMVKLLEKMQIDFKGLSKKYMLLTFPQSLDGFHTEKIYDLRYEELNNKNHV